ncbi:MAG: DUF2267 domain-containing protein [Polyangiaceae bacterium]|nr:DUF2267 domain-containing protein [Polyangiaceae bacterium]
MDEDDTLSIVARVKEALGMLSDDDTERAIDAVLDAIGRLLTPDEAGSIAQHLPARLATILVLASESTEAVDSERDVVSLVASREGMPASAAYETVKVTCEVFAGYLPEDVVERLQHDLPSELAALLVHPHGEWCVPEPVVPVSAPVRRRRGATTLASGRPGSSHPVSESRPERAHSNSVVRNPNPHGDTKLSSGR